MRAIRNARRQAVVVLLPAVLGVLSGLVAVRELRASTTSNCYTWMYCSGAGGGSCKDADEYVGGCETNGVFCDTPCQ